MKLRVGLLTHSRIWEEALSGEGVPFAVVEPQTALSPQEWSVIVAGRSPSAAEAEIILSYLRSGGAVLASARHLRGIAGVEAREERIAFLLPEQRDLLSGLGLLDLNLDGAIPQEANTMKTQSQVFALFAGQLLGGWAVLLPFDVEEALGDFRAVNKNFYALRERLPSERVSSVGKGEVRRLLHASLRFLHSSRGIPYVHLWYFPDGRRNQFAYRLDTDKSTREEIDTMAVIAREFPAPLSWYLDVRSHESWLEHFRFLAGGETGVHCYDHEVFADREANRKNFARAKHAMERAGLRPEGFAAPYGKWNLSLGHVVDELEFLYSSEFSFAYDAYPMLPQTREFSGRALQVPIHPICIGSLRKIGYTEEQMTQYFARVVQEKLARHEPLFFYHHPVHKTWNVVRRLFADLRDRGVEGTTLGSFARWWIRRKSVAPAISYEDGTVEITPGRSPEGAEGEPWLRIVNPAGEEALVRCEGPIRLDGLQWEHPEPGSVPEDVARIREFDPRRLLGDVYTSMIRRLK